MIRSLRRPLGRVAFIALTGAVAISVVAPSASATATVRRIWNAGIGSAAYYGSATLWSYLEGNGFLHVSAHHLAPNTSYSVAIIGGTCSKPGVTAVSLPPIASDAAGTADRYNSLGGTQMNAVWKYAHTGHIAIRIGGSARCGNLKFLVATRVYIPNISGINLPVVEPPGSTTTFPYCNVAMYFESLSQPGEPGVTMLFAHARTHMFLPLLTISRINNGASMVGKLVYVYTSNNRRYTYKIFKVARHVTSVQTAFSTWTPQLWLQTSEGPNASSLKLIIKARLISVTTTTYAQAHPTPHPVVCR